MPKLSSVSHVSSLALVTCLAVVIAPTAVNAAEELPSGVRSRVKQINTRLDQALKALEAKRLTTAQRKLKDAQKLRDEINKRYSGKFSPEQSTYKAMAERLAEVAAKVQAAERAAEDAASAAKKAKEAKEALSQSWIAKLEPFMDRKNELYLRYAAEFNRASPKDQAKSKAAYPKAKALFDQYQKAAFPLGKTPELQNVESRLASVLRYYGQEEAKAKQKQACQEWEYLLAPFVVSGRPSRKVLIASPTANPADMKRQQAIATHSNPAGRVVFDFPKRK